MRIREPRRVVDPAKPTSDYAATVMGVRSQRDLERAAAEQSRFLDDQQRRGLIVPARSLTFYTEAVTGTTTSVMRRAPKSASMMPTMIRFPLGAAGRIFGVSLWCSSARTGGNAIARLRLSKGGGAEATYLVSDAVIDGATVDGHQRSQSAEWLCPVPNGIRFAKGDALRIELVLTGWTSASTPDWGAEVLLVYDGLS